MSSDQVLFAYCTFPSKEVAEQICEQLVAERLVACANILGGHTAIYSWQGKITKESEVGVILKTTVRRKIALVERIRAKHPYSIPALTFWPVDDGVPEFLQWVCGQTF